MIVTAHQPNFLPGMNVLDKIDCADAVIWLDEVQYTKGGWTNRNQTPSESWITVPVQRDTDGLAINRVRISADREWRTKMVATITQTWGGQTWPVCHEIMRPYRSLIGLNAALLNVVMPLAAPKVRQHWQSHLDGGHAIAAVGATRHDLKPISERLAMMVAEVGGTVYLSGPSGRGYLDEEPFQRHEIEVRYYEHFGAVGCSASLLRTLAPA